MHVLVAVAGGRADIAGGSGHGGSVDGQGPHGRRCIGCAAAGGARGKRGLWGGAQTRRVRRRGGARGHRPRTCIAGARRARGQAPGVPRQERADSALERVVLAILRGRGCARCRVPPPAGCVPSRSVSPCARARARVRGVRRAAWARHCASAARPPAPGARPARSPAELRLWAARRVTAVRAPAPCPCDTLHQLGARGGRAVRGKCPHSLVPPGAAPPAGWRSVPGGA